MKNNILTAYCGSFDAETSSKKFPYFGESFTTDKPYKQLTLHVPAWK